MNKINIQSKQTFFIGLLFFCFVIRTALVIAAPMQENRGRVSIPSIAPHGIFHVNVNEFGSRTSGIQEAINRANANGGGIVQLNCGTTYNLTTSKGGWISLANMTKITVRGCGPESTVVQAVGDFSALDFNAITIDGTAKFIILEDFTLNIDNTCATGDCNPSNGWDNAIIIGGTVNHIEIHRLNVKMIAVEQIAPVTNKAKVRGIHMDCTQNVPDKPLCSDISIKDNLLEASDRNLEVFSANNVDIINNHIQNPSAAGKAAAGMQFLKYVGTGIRVIGNHFDLATPAASLPLHNHIGINLRSSLNTFLSAVSTQVIGNTFYNLPDDLGSIGIRIIGYDLALINGNYFKCADTANCNAIGIKLENDNLCTDCNQGNVITANVFEGFHDNTSSGGPIYFADDKDKDNRGNIIKNNIFDLASTTRNGFEKGDQGSLKHNYIDGNISLNRVAGASWMSGKVGGIDAQTLAAAATTIALSVNGDIVTLTGEPGANSVATISGGAVNRVITINCVDALVTIKDTDAHTDNTVDLAGTATNFVCAADAQLILKFDGTSWREQGRSLN